MNQLDVKLLLYIKKFSYNAIEIITSFLLSFELFVSNVKIKLWNAIPGKLRFIFLMTVQDFIMNSYDFHDDSSRFSKEQLTFS